MQVADEEKTPPANKYTVRPPKDLRSKYELKMEERRMKELADEETELRSAEQERLRVRVFVSFLVTANDSGLLLQTEQHGLSVCLCLCVGHFHESCKQAELVEISFRGLTCVSPKDPVLDRLKVGRIHSSSEG